MVILWFLFCFTSKKVRHRRVATIRDLSIESISNTKTNEALSKDRNNPLIRELEKDKVLRMTTSLIGSK